jgi:hypothetical protein
MEGAEPNPILHRIRFQDKASIEVSRLALDTESGTADVTGCVDQPLSLICGPLVRQVLTESLVLENRAYV